MDTETRPKKNLLPAILIVSLLIILYALASYLIIFRPARKIQQPPIAMITPTPSPTPKPLPSGKQTYRFSHGQNVTGPKPQTVVVDPLTPAPGEKQTVTVIIASDSPIIEAKATLDTDHDSNIYPLTASQGETWEATWTINDSYDYTYYLHLFLKSADGTFENGLRFR